MDTPQYAQRRLHRSRTDRMVFGVCGGLAEYFEVDPVIVRLAFVLVTIAGGAGVLAYLILAIVLPEEGVEPLPGREGLRRNIDTLKANVAGTTGTEPGTPFEGSTTPGYAPEPRARRGAELGAFILIGIGLLVLIGNFGWFGWFRWDLFWPIILVLIGVGLLVRRTNQ